MRIGVPKEIKPQEHRVALIPGGVGRLVESGHEVRIESGAGDGSGLSDSDYKKAGAVPVSTDEVWAESELIVKVKEPQPEEWPRIRKDQVLFTFFHFASSKTLTEAMLRSGATCIAYETVATDEGFHPILTPMSEIAGRLAVLHGTRFLEKTGGGKGQLICGVPGVRSGHVVILGGGTVGESAAKVASGLEARVTILDIDLERLRYLEDVLPMNVSTLYASKDNILQMLEQADLVIGGVHRSGSRTPHLVSRKDLKRIKPGSVLVDVAIDQGGCFESSRPTTHAEPVYEEEGVLHYCVANMPGCVPRTSTYALTNATIDLVALLADRGEERAVSQRADLQRGLNIIDGNLVHSAVAQAHGMRLVPIEDLLK
ncbi:MAG: alanine dehydrogenase [Candidatus Omnitrophica bacterium]|nr:alanine dehydrogenase [Candidatus Omnitrophota bacterium]